MRASDTFSLATRNLRQSLLRTTLTALGVSIGIASLVGMLSLGVGLQEQVLGRLMKSAVFDQITVFQGRAPAIRGFGRGGGGRRGADAAPAAPEKVARLDDRAID